MHANTQMEDWVVYLIVFGAVALMMAGKVLLVSKKTEEKND